MWNDALMFDTMQVKNAFFQLNRYYFNKRSIHMYTHKALYKGESEWVHLWVGTALFVFCLSIGQLGLLKYEHKNVFSWPLVGLIFYIIP